MAEREAEFRAFWTKLSTDPGFRREFGENRAYVMDAAGLSARQKIAVLTLDQKAIQAEFGVVAEGEVALFHVDVEVVIRLHVT